MSFVIADRVKETSTTNGTGTLDLDGAASGFQSFVNGIGTGNETTYLISDGTDWEVGIGTVTDAATDTLSRDTVLASSNGGSLVNWTGGTDKDVACVFAASARLPTLTLFSKDAGSSIGPKLSLLRKSSSPSDSDNLGAIDFIGHDSTSADTVYGRIHTEIGDVTDGTEDGEIVFSVMVNGTLTEIARVDSSGLTNPATDGFPSGTRLMFNNNNADIPVGWTRQTGAALSDSLPIITTGTTVGNGGTNNAITILSGSGLNTSSAGSHSHPAGTLTAPLQYGRNDDSSGIYQPFVARDGWIQSREGDDVDLALEGNTGSAGSHSHSVVPDVRYNEFIVAEKD